MKKLFEQIYRESYQDDLANFNQHKIKYNLAQKTYEDDDVRYQKEIGEITSEIKDILSSTGCEIISVNRNTKDSWYEKELGEEGNIKFVIEVGTGATRNEEPFNFKIHFDMEHMKYYFDYLGTDSRESYEYDRLPARTKAKLYSAIADITEYLDNEENWIMISTKMSRKLLSSGKTGSEFSSAHQDLLLSRNKAIKSYNLENVWNTGSTVSFRDGNGKTKSAVIEQVNEPEGWAKIITENGRKTKIDLDQILSKSSPSDLDY